MHFKTIKIHFTMPNYHRIVVKTQNLNPSLLKLWVAEESEAIWHLSTKEIL